MRKGLRLVKIPAIQYCINNVKKCNEITTAITFPNIAMMKNAVPEYDIFKNIPKMYIGNKGIITDAITRSMMPLNSVSMVFNVSPLLTEIPIPNINARVKAVITPKTGGISIVKNVVNSEFAGLSTVATFVGIKNGRVILHEKYAKKPANNVAP